MRRCLLILPLLLLTAPAAAHAKTGLSATPAGLRAGQAWHVDLTAPAHSRPAIVTTDADGDTTTFRARPTGTPGHYAATVRFPRPGQWSYAVDDGLATTPPATYPAVIIKPAAPATTVRRPDPVGPPGIPIALAGALLLGGLALWLARRRRHPPARLA